MEINVKRFYDIFSERQIDDFIKGNPRLESAISFVISNIPRTSSSILDIGCGIGWSSYEIAKHFNKSDVVGIDLSENNIKYAKTLFNRLNLKFFEGNIKGIIHSLNQKFDCIILIDIYEHISRQDRSNFNIEINNILNDNGIMLLTCPTIYHQNWLKRNKPEGLQPVDEDIDEFVLNNFAHQINGILISFELKNIWNDNDYFHAIIAKGKFSKNSFKSKNKANILSQVDRLAIYKKAYPKLMKNIAIISPYKNAISETFIKAHREKINGNIFLLHGGFFPYLFGENDIPLNSFLPKQPTRNIEKACKMLPQYFYVRFKNRFFPEKKYNHTEVLTHFFDANGIEVVLAEYGPTACEVLPSCILSNTKLIVHFHGFDAFDRDIIDKYVQKYKEIFDYASYIIVVSNVMKDKVKNMGCPESKLVLNPYGPNDIFLNAIPLFIKKQFIAIGRFVDKKAPYYTIFAFQKVLEKHPDAKLIMAGEGELLNTCKNLVRMLNLSDKITFPGVISPEKFQELLSESIAFVQHSITADNGDMEGTPVAILEASAAGLPVISTKHAGILDVIINEETGLLVDEHDVDGMAKNMIRVLNNFDFAKKLGTLGKQRIKENFTMGNHIAVIQSLIDNV